MTDLKNRDDLLKLGLIYLFFCTKIYRLLELELTGDISYDNLLKSPARITPQLGYLVYSNSRENCNIVA